MQVEELRWFVAVVDDPHLTRTASALFVSQSALSRSLRRLESTVGVELFDRVGRSLIPNEYGRSFAADVRRALDALDDGRAAVQAAADPETGQVRLAFLHTLGTWLVPDLIGSYRALHPSVRFALGQDSAGEMNDGLRTGIHDLVLTSPRPQGDGLGWHALFDEPMKLAVPPGHRLAARKRVRLEDVADEPFVLMRVGYGLREVTDGLCAAAGFTPRVAFEGEDSETLRGLVRAGLGVALLPARPGSPPSPPLLAIADAGAHRTIGLAWSTERYRSPVVRAFADFVIASDFPRS